jgi:hypothetical protein
MAYPYSFFIIMPLGLMKKASLWKFSSASAIIEILVFVWKDLVIVDDDIKVYQMKKAYAFLLLWGFFEVYLFFLVRVNMEFLLSSTNNNSKVDVL